MSALLAAVLAASPKSPLAPYNRVEPTPPKLAAAPAPKPAAPPAAADLDAAQNGALEVSEDSRRPFGELQKRAQDPSTAIVPYVDKSDNVLMREAAKCGNVLELTRLLDRGVPVERESTKNRSPLMDACAGGHVDAVKFLLSCGADAERMITRGDSATPLVLAAWLGQDLVVEQLLDHGVDTERVMPCGKAKGMTALQVARRKGHRDVVDLLEKGREEPPSPSASYNMDYSEEEEEDERDDEDFDVTWKPSKDFDTNVVEDDDVREPKPKKKKCPGPSPKPKCADADAAERERERERKREEKLAAREAKRLAAAAERAAAKVEAAKQKDAKLAKFAADSALAEINDTAPPDISVLSQSEGKAFRVDFLKYTVERYPGRKANNRDEYVIKVSKDGGDLAGARPSTKLDALHLLDQAYADAGTKGKDVFYKPFLKNGLWPAVLYKDRKKTYSARAAAVVAYYKPWLPPWHRS